MPVTYLPPLDFDVSVWKIEYFLNPFLHQLWCDIFFYNGAFDDVSDWAKFSSALDSIQEAVDEFDSTFPSKEKAVTPSQVEFEKAVSQLDTTEYEIMDERSSPLPKSNDTYMCATNKI